MAGTTPKRLLPYPSNADVPNVAGDINALATAVDTQFGSVGKCIIATPESRPSAPTVFGTLTTPDQVTGIVVPTDGIVVVVYTATWQESVSSAASAAIFIGANQLTGASAGAAVPGVSQTSHTHGASDQPLFSTAGGLSGLTQTGGFADVTTGQLIGTKEVTGADTDLGGPCYIRDLPAGTYTFSVQFKSTSGSVTVKNRKLRVCVWTFG